MTHIIYGTVGHCVPMSAYILPQLTSGKSSSYNKFDTIHIKIYHTYVYLVIHIYIYKHEYIYFSLFCLTFVHYRRGFPPHNRAGGLLVW